MDTSPTTPTLPKTYEIINAGFYMDIEEVYWKLTEGMDNRHFMQVNLLLTNPSNH